MIHTTHRAASGLVVPAVLVSVTALLLLPVADASAQGRRRPDPDGRESGSAPA